MVPFFVRFQQDVKNGAGVPESFSLTRERKEKRKARCQAGGKYQSRDRRGQKLRIDSSYVGMESARKYSSAKMGSTRFTYGRILNGNSGQTNFGQLFNTDVKENESGDVKNSQSDSRTKTGSLQERFQSMRGVNRFGSQRQISSTLDKLREECMRHIFELLFGGRRGNRAGGSGQSFEEWMQQTTGMSSLSSASASVTVFGYETEFIQTEQETTAFSTVGTVKTADGRSINFNVNVEMSRSFTEYYKENYQQTSVNVCDPLVINLDTDVAELSDQKFFFDLDADGVKDEISMLGKGSGYLALDKNNDGVINDGSELFGTASGDGFADLAKYDDDGDGWIDEDDEIWSKLKIWSKDENGNDVLYGLADKGVGAICLQKVGTQFSLNSQETNATNGYIRSTGVFLYENGMAGTVQHVDVATNSFQAVG